MYFTFVFFHGIISFKYIKNWI